MPTLQEDSWVEIYSGVLEGNLNVSTPFSLVGMLPELLSPA